MEGLKSNLNCSKKSPANNESALDYLNAGINSLGKYIKLAAIAASLVVVDPACAPTNNSAMHFRGRTESPVLFACGENVKKVEGFLEKNGCEYKGRNNSIILRDFNIKSLAPDIECHTYSDVSCAAPAPVLQENLSATVYVCGSDVNGARKQVLNSFEKLGCISKPLEVESLDEAKCSIDNVECSR